MRHETRRETLFHIAECAAKILDRAAVIVDDGNVYSESVTMSDMDCWPCKCMEVAAAWLLSDALERHAGMSSGDIRDLVPTAVAEMAFAEMATA